MFLVFIYLQKKMKKSTHNFISYIVYCLFLFVYFILNIWFSKAQNDFSIIPEKSSTNIWQIVENIWASGWSVIENYKNAAYGKKNADWSRAWSTMTLWDQLASWVMTRDTLLEYVTYIVRFLLQIWLLIWAIVMIYLWYKKITEFWKFESSWIKYVVMWVAVLAFAYAIIKMLVSMFIK